MMAPDVMLLAAGRGIRMGVLTDSVPKPLISVAGRPLIDHVVETCAGENLTRFVVNVHHLPAPMLAHIALLARLMPELRFRISDETAHLLDTGGGAKKALALLDTDPVLVANADSFWQPGADRPITRMAAAMGEGTDIVLLCADPARATGFRGRPDFGLDPDARVSMPDGPGKPAIYAGRALIRRSVLASAPSGAFSLFALFSAAVVAGRLAGVMLATDWLHVGDPEAIIEAEARLAG